MVIIQGRRVLEDLTGQRFGRWAVIERAPNKGKVTMWHCKCDCGNEKDVCAAKLKNGESRSCGCLQKEIVSMRDGNHHLSSTRLHRIWGGMKTRCYNSNYPQYKDYGGRGITVCAEWSNSFTAFYNWAMSNGYQDGLTLDRIDNDKGYSPDNCRWATQKFQNNHKRSNVNITYNGETHNIAEWAEILDIPRQTLRDRIQRYNWPVERALTEPVRKWPSQINKTQ